MTDTDAFSRRGVATLLLCRLALQSPPDKHWARDTVPKTGSVRASSCPGLLPPTAGGKAGREGDPHDRRGWYGLRTQAEPGPVH